MGDYLDAVREVEQRIQRAEQTNETHAAAGGRAAVGRARTSTTSTPSC